MSKVPVLSTVSRTYGFLLGDIVTVLQVAWLPMLLAVGVNYYYGQQLNPALVMKGGPEAAMQASALGFGIGIVSLLANIMVTVALLRVVMFGQRPSAPFHIWFGMTELRTLLVYVLLTVALIAAVLAGTLVLGIVGAAASSAGGGAIIGVIAVALVFVLLWAMLKLTILPAVILAENTLGVERAWSLSKGNAFRLFIVFLLTYIPFGIVMLMAMGAVLGGSIPAFADMSVLQDPQNAEASTKAFEQAMTAWQLAFTAAMYENWLAYSILNFVSSIVSAALFAGIAGNAYMALAGNASREDVSLT
jgi:hypothetical protein